MMLVCITNQYQSILMQFVQSRDISNSPRSSVESPTSAVRCQCNGYCREDEDDQPCGKGIRRNTKPQWMQGCGGWCVRDVTCYLIFCGVVAVRCCKNVKTQNRRTNVEGEKGVRAQGSITTGAPCARPYLYNAPMLCVYLYDKYKRHTCAVRTASGGMVRCSVSRRRRLRRGGPMTVTCTTAGTYRLVGGGNAACVMPPHRGRVRDAHLVPRAGRVCWTVDAKPVTCAIIV